MKRNEILGEHKKGVKAVKHNKKPKDHSAEYGKAKEKLAPVKPMESYNPNSVAAQHARELKAHHRKDLETKANNGDESAKRRLQSLNDKEEQMRNDYNDRMERESVAQEGRKYYGYDDSGMSLRPGNDEGPDSWDYSSAHDRIGAGDPRRPRRPEPAADVPHDVHINGRKWKTFGSKSHAENVARKLAANGKTVDVKASLTDEDMGADVGKITKVDPATKKATLTKPDGSSMEVDSTALKPTPDGKMSMDVPDTDELKTGTAVVSTEDMTAPTTDSESPINGDEEKPDLRRLRELAGQPVAEGGITLPNADGSLPPGAFTADGQEKLNKMVGDKMNGKDLDNGFTLTTTDFQGKSVPAIFDTQDNAYWIENNSGSRQYGIASHIQIKDGKAKGMNPGPQTAAAMKAAGWKISEPKPRTEPAPDASANEPFVPKDYQTKEPLTKGPDGKWRNSKGEERDSLHGGPISAGGSAMFRSLTPRTPTPESADNVLLQKMLSIAGLR
jgi:hypothetical protein